MEVGKRLGVITLIICILLAWATCFAVWNINKTFEYFEYKIEELEHENLEMVEILGTIVKNENTIVDYVFEIRKDLDTHSHSKLN